MTVMNWNIVRSFGNSPPARAAILMPFIGYLIFLNDFIQRILVTKFPSAAGAISFDGLYYFYIGAVFVGMGSMVYYIKCPEPIRTFSNDRDFVSAYLKNINSKKLLDICRELEKISPVDNGKILALKALQEGYDFSIGNENSTYILYSYYNFLINKGFFWLYFCICMYSVGIFLIMIPTVMSVYKVFRIILF